jgi:hypothetical protein
MGVPASEVGYTSAITGRGDHEVHKGHVVALAKKTLFLSVNLVTSNNFDAFFFQSHFLIPNCLYGDEVLCRISSPDVIRTACRGDIKEHQNKTK